MQPCAFQSSQPFSSLASQILGNKEKGGSGIYEMIFYDVASQLDLYEAGVLAGGVTVTGFVTASCHSRVRGV